MDYEAYDTKGSKVFLSINNLVPRSSEGPGDKVILSMALFCKDVARSCLGLYSNYSYSVLYHQLFCMCISFVSLPCTAVFTEHCNCLEL